MPIMAEAGCGGKETLTSSSRVVSRTRLWTTCWVALAPTRPPRPGPDTGGIGRLVLRVSIRSLSRLRLLLPRSSSLNMGSACGVIIGASINALDASSIVTFFAIRESSSLAPFWDMLGE